jgi:lysophospholipid acyltransferase (LPLAT)-like uncharacterized protein
MTAKFLSWMVAGLVALLRSTCRVRFHDDPREQLRAAGQGYVYGFLHAHQMSIIVGSESGTAAMVSRSRDGQLVVPALKLAGCIVFRGSKKSNNRARGGQQAIDSLIQHVRHGGPAAIAVDGPRGPRGRVHKGLAMVSQQSGAAVLVIVAKPKYRWIATQAWDRLQLPLPFSRIEGYFAPPVYPQAGEKLEAYRQRIETVLRELESRLDPAEFRYSVGAETTISDEPTVDQTGGRWSAAA